MLYPLSYEGVAFKSLGFHFPSGTVKKGCPVAAP